MLREGPPLELLLRRLVEIPPEFLAEPRFGQTGEIHVAAVVWDVLRDVGRGPLADAGLAPFRSEESERSADRNYLRLVLVACWLLGDTWFQGQEALAAAAHRFLADVLRDLQTYLPVERLVDDADRREEFVRRLLHDLGLRPAGETPAQAMDRLQTLDSVERVRVLRDARASERRAQAVREAMARAAAQDAASRYGE